MIAKRGFNTKTNLVNKVIKGIIISAKAEEPTVDETPQEEVKTTPVVNYEDLIAKARKEEKDKLYSQLQGKDSKINDLTEKNNSLLLGLSSKDEEIKALKNEIKGLKSANTKSENETIRGLEDDKNNLLATIDQLKNEQVQIEEIENRIKEEYEVKLYRMEKLNSVGDEIISELVTGTTKEEIDASFEVAKAKYDSIKERYVSKSTQSIPVANVDTSSLNANSINATDISKMSPSEWAEYRAKLGLK